MISPNSTSAAKRGKKKQSTHTSYRSAPLKQNIQNFQGVTLMTYHFRYTCYYKFKL